MPENTSQKRLLIDRANRSMFVAIAVGAMLVVVALVSMRSLYELSSHRSRVIKEKKVAEKTLIANDEAVGELIASFKAFEETPESLLGTSEKNSKIVLDSLPPQYDFPALATSLEKILTEGGYTINEITGKDNEATEEDINSPDPSHVEMPFTITVSGPYEKVKNLPVDLERSIRPIRVVSIDLSGSAADSKMIITAKTYYQPSKNLDVRFKEVK